MIKQEEKEQQELKIYRKRKRKIIEMIKKEIVILKEVYRVTKSKGFLGLIDKTKAELKFMEIIHND